MADYLIGLRNTPAQNLARLNIESRVDTRKLFAAIDADPAVSGAGVVYIDADFNVVTLREFRPICSIKPKRIIIREAQRNISPQQFAQQVKTNPRESRLLAESVNTSLSCAGAVLGWIAVIGGTAIVPFTGGASLFIAGVGLAATAAGTAQCGIGMARVVNEINHPERNDELDSEEWYQNVSKALDIVSLAGVGATGATIAKVMTMRKAMTGRSWFQSLKGLNRQERRRLTNEILENRNPALTPAMRKALQRTGELPKRMPAREISSALAVNIKDAFSVGLGLVGSNMVQTYAIGLYEELEE
ncbi:NAD synthetase [Pseudomonas sp. DTU_2021_1001937_2_SI_NGA_ILE_001]|uniref:NAD synthetase n=1 Tax=Pseudomonas sp. DTU_2021_1001937_2_SI_NGA_ILE_001 TaxID=3077589 RepID=UPI0028FC29EA|nr:NAD synthetase [Pseudomonas sp. DTU_2021_1001937_2_SI_NGA_ILE_001]WNW12452.1 NAD synthetase [Pseudomonas sp. DTU_2021_1001937_2_SI_NGA_ILE_001]